MKLTRILPMVLLVGVGAVALSANDLIAASALAAPAQGSKAPTTRLGAEMAKDLGESQRGVASRAQSLDMKARMLEATSRRLQAQAGATPPAEETPSPQAAEAKQKADESTMQLVKVYQSMKPKVAGPIFERLDLDIQVAIASKMRNQSMANIMQATSADGATRLTTALARPNSTPAWKPATAAPPTGMPVAPKAPTAASNQIPKGSPVAGR